MGAISKTAGRSPDSINIRVREAPIKPLPPVIKMAMVSNLA